MKLHRRYYLLTVRVNNEVLTRVEAYSGYEMDDEYIFFKRHYPDCEIEVEYIEE